MDPDAARLLEWIAGNVKARRLQMGLTMAEAGAKVGIHWRHWQKVEAREVNVTVETLARIARALRVEASALLRAPQRAARTQKRRW